MATERQSTGSSPLVDIMREVYETKIRLKRVIQSVLETDSDDFEEYVTLTHNAIVHEYNRGYADGYRTIFSTANENDFIDGYREYEIFTPSIPSYTTEITIDNLIVIMKDNYRIRLLLKDELNTSSDEFVTYPDILEELMVAAYNEGYDNGIDDATYDTFLAPTILQSAYGETITIVNNADFGALYYWINDDSSNKIQYTGPFTINETCTIHAYMTYQGVISPITTKVCYLYEQEYLTIEILDDIEEDRLRFAIGDYFGVYDGEPQNINSPLFYSINNSEWVQSTALRWNSGGGNGARGSLFVNQKVNKGDKIRLKTNKKYREYSYSEYGTYAQANPINISILSKSKCRYNVYGNIYSVLSTDPFNSASWDTDLYGPNGSWVSFNDADGSYNSTQKIYMGEIISAEHLVIPGVPRCGAIFRNCTSLTTPPKLPSTILRRGSYSGMFKGCTSLTTAPDLPARDLTDNEACYNEMFYGCTSLTTPPIISATKLAETGAANFGCCYRMFYGCTSLTTAPALHATELAHECYKEMFKGCTSLTTVPALPATELALECYKEMFKGCTSLTTAPSMTIEKINTACCSAMFTDCTSLVDVSNIKLNALVVSDGCYREMFKGCTSLTTAPDLPAPATTSFTGCYREMFYECSNLNYIKCLGNDNGVTYQWVYRVSPTGTFVKKSGVTWLIGTSGIPEGWIVQEDGIDVTSDYLTISLSETGSITITKSEADETGEYKVNDGSWTRYTSGPLTLNNVSTLQLRNFSENWCTSLGRGIISTSVEHTVYGDISTLFNDNTITHDHLFTNDSTLISGSGLVLGNIELKESEFASMFSGCTSLRSAPSLPATTLADFCYDYMFYRCTSLTSAPALPATTLAVYCYRAMFEFCTSLTSAPALPATTLAVYCYSAMFEFCTSLTSAPDLNATTLANYCYIDMFGGCTSLRSAPLLPATTLKFACYSDMFAGCSSLEIAPDLLATTLTGYCYYAMFNGCTHLNYVKCLATNISATECISGWLDVVSSSGTFVKKSGVTWPSGGDGIPSGWTVQEVA